MFGKKVTNQPQDPIIELNGWNGQIYLYSDRIKIGRKGIKAKITQNWALKGDKTIPIKSISAIQLRKPGFGVGYIQFTIPGGNESRSGLSAASSDENTVELSDMKQYNIAIQIQEKIYEIQNAQSAPLMHNNNTISNLDEIKKLKELLDIGAITQEEFNKKKSDLLK